MSTYFLEIVFQSDEFEFEGRDEVEDPIDEALSEADLGEITGGGAGLGIVNIDVEVSELDAGVKLIRDVLNELGVASSTVINYYAEGQDKPKVFKL